MSVTLSNAGNASSPRRCKTNLLDVFASFFVVCNELFPRFFALASI